MQPHAVLVRGASLIVVAVASACAVSARADDSPSTQGELDAARASSAAHEGPASRAAETHEAAAPRAVDAKRDEESASSAVQSTLSTCVQPQTTIVAMALQSGVCPRLLGLDAIRVSGARPLADPLPERVGPLEVRIAGVWIEAESKHLRSLPLVVRGGMVPLPSLSAINASWRRFAGPSGGEAAGLLSGMAFGSTLSVQVPARLGDVTVGLFHPNGFLTNDATRVPFLTGARAWISPIDPLLPTTASSPLRLLASTEEAALGPDKGRRFVVGAALEHRLAIVGGDRSYARGLFDDASRQAGSWGGFFTLRPHPRFDGFVRYDVVDSVLAERVRLVTAGLAFRGPRLERFFQGLDVQASFHRVQGGQTASIASLGGAVPDALGTQQTFRLNVHVRF